MSRKNIVEFVENCWEGRLDKIINRETLVTRDHTVRDLGATLLHHSITY